MNQHTTNASYREILIEHLFVGEVMRRLWLRGITQFEVLKPQVDDSGYDLVLEANGVLRHVQLKSSFRGATTAGVRVGLRLASKPSGCVVWIQFDSETMELGPFLWFGGQPGTPLPDIRDFPVAKHTRGDATGFKKERPNMRRVRRAKFTRIATLDELVTVLFGEFPIEPPA